MHKHPTDMCVPCTPVEHTDESHFMGISERRMNQVLGPNEKHVKMRRAPLTMYQREFSALMGRNCPK